MPREITRIEVPEPEPMHPTDDGGAETQGAAYRLSAPAVATEPLTVTAPDGTTLTWVPTELCYRDESGQMDYIVGSAPATVHVRDREARYKRTFPVADDVFRAEAERVKHWVILHEPPRAPAEYLSGAIEFGVTGLVSGIHLPEGRHDEIEAGPFRLPKPVARDLSGQEIAGYYEVVPADQGQQLFVWFPAAEVLAATYPVVIDPTIITTGYYIRPTEADNGVARDGTTWYVGVRAEVGDLRVYRSTDNGQTWTDLGRLAGYVEAASFALVVVDGVLRVYYWGESTSDDEGIYERRYIGGQWTTPVRVLAQQQRTGVIGGVAARVDASGEVHVAWSEIVSGVGRVYYARTNGGAWGTPIDTSVSIPNAPSLNPPSLAVSGSTIVVAARSVSIYAVSTDGGASFTTVSGDFFYHGHLTVDAQGTIWAVYASPTTVYARPWAGSAWGTRETIAQYGSPITQVMRCVPVGDGLVVFYRPPTDATLLAAVRQNGDWSVNVWQSVSDAYSGLSVPQQGADFGTIVVWAGAQVAGDYPVKADYFVAQAPPYAPLLAPRDAFDATEDAIFRWTFSDPNPGDSQSAYQLLIKRASDGAVVYDTGKVTSSAQQHTLPGGTLQNGVQYRWSVRTWDSLDQAGPYATEHSFLTSAKPTVTITDPATDGAVIGTPSHTMQWSMSDPESKGQSAYQVVLKDGSGNVVHDSGKVQSMTARAYTLQNLQNNTSYTVELTVWDGDGVASNVVTRTFHVQYTPPPTPDVSVEALEAWVRITIANHNAGAEVQATSNDVYRRMVGEAGNGIRIATNVPVDGVMYDYAVASGVAYEYRVVAIGENGTTAASAWVQAPVLKLTGAWIHDPADPANTIRQFRVAADRSENWEPVAETFQFAGRKFPVAEFGEQTDQRVKTAIIVLPDSLADLYALRRLADLRTVLCYRDSAGRRIFGVLGPLNIRDERHGGYTVEIEIQAVDYDEAV